MEKEDAVRLIKYAKSVNLDPAAVLKMRMAFDSMHVKPGPPRKDRPKGMITMGEACKKYGLNSAALVKLRARGMPTVKRGTAILVDKKVLNEWLEKMFKE